VAALNLTQLLPDRRGNPHAPEVNSSHGSHNSQKGNNTSNNTTSNNSNNSSMLVRLALVR